MIRDILRRAIIAMTIALIATACSHDHRLLDTIPADATAVAKINIKTVAPEAGIDFDAPRPFSDRVARTLGDAAPVMVAANACGDLSRTLVFSYGGGLITTFELTDADRMHKALTEDLHFKAEEKAGFTVYGLRSQRQTMVLRDRQAWLVTFPADIDDLREALGNASQENITSVKGVAERLTKDTDLCYAVNISGERDARAQWFCIEADIAPKSVDATVEMIDGNGKRVEQPAMLTLDGDVLKHLPSPITALMAFGIDGARVDWQSISAPLTMLSGIRIRGYIDMILPYLRAIDGTVAIAAGTDAGVTSSSSADPSEWEATFMAHMPKSDIAGIRALLARNLAFPGISITDTADGTTLIKVGEMCFYLADVDGYLAVSTHPFATHPAPADATRLFDGSTCAVLIDIPSLASFSPQLPQWGVRLEASGDSSSGKLHLTLPGSDKPLLQTLLEL